jgi:hypothetical protein
MQKSNKVEEIKSVKTIEEQIEISRLSPYKIAEGLLASMIIID